MVAGGGRITHGRFPRRAGSDTPSSRAVHRGMSAGVPCSPRASGGSDRLAGSRPSRLADRVSGWPGAGGGAEPEPDRSVPGRSRMAQSLPFRSRTGTRFTLRRFRDLAFPFGRHAAACGAPLRSLRPILMRSSALRLPPPGPPRPAASSTSAACRQTPRQPRQLVVRVPLPDVAASAEFRQGAVQMPSAHAMVGGVRPTFEDRPERLDPIGTDLAPQELPGGVVHPRMPEALQRRMGQGRGSVHCGAGRAVSRTNPCSSPLVVFGTGRASTSPLVRSRAPTTGCLPTVPRPARSFLRACLLRSLPPR